LEDSSSLFKPSFFLNIKPNCYPADGLPLGLAEAVAVILIGIFFTYLMWNLKDVYLFKYELIFLIVIAAPFLFLFAIADAFGWNGWLNGEVWYDFWELLCLLGTLGFPGISSFFYSRRINRGKRFTIVSYSGLNDKSLAASASREIELELSSNAIPKQQNELKGLFLQCMADEKVERELESFAAKCFCVENILFYQAYLIYKEKSKAEDLRIEATKIVSKFIQIGSPCEINIDESANLS